MTTASELKDALTHALDNPTDTATIPGLPADPWDCQAHLWTLQTRWQQGNGPKFQRQAREAFLDWATNEGPWQD